MKQTIAWQDHSTQLIEQLIEVQIPKSCLFAKIRRLAPANFSWLKISRNCFLHSSNLQRSTESTTHIIPSVISK